MFRIIQSNDTQQLAQLLGDYYQNDERSLFDTFVVIVPAKVLEAWLKRTLAQQLGAVSLFTTQFWGQYEWQLIARILQIDAKALKALGRDKDILQVPEQAVLSASVIRWRLFGFFNEPAVQAYAKDDKHPLYFLLAMLPFDESGRISKEALWQLCDDLAKTYVGYLTERNDWLSRWATGQAVDVPALIAQKDSFAHAYGRDDTTPEWLQEEFVALEAALRFLWQTLFKTVYERRQALQARFWQVLASNQEAQAALPSRLYLFTVQQLPVVELDFLYRLSQYCEVILLHFNPSMMFWADIVDKAWLQTQTVINPDSVYLKDYGHGLLSRLGKASRETFAMLAQLSGGEYEAVDWQETFSDNKARTSLLHALQYDILMLNETPHSDPWALDDKHKAPPTFVLDRQAMGLSIHNCHSLKRELEIARIMIGQWLNADNSRTLADVAIMLPEVDSHRELIEAVFGTGAGLDGLYLPVSITGVTDNDVLALWQGILGVYRLPMTRFYYADFCEWLLLECVYHSFGLSFVMAQRACELLRHALFVRGLNERHLKATLHACDSDYQRTFAYALDRLVLSLSIVADSSGLLYPSDDMRRTVMVAEVGLADAPIIDALCAIYQAFTDKDKDNIHEHSAKIGHWLWHIEDTVINRYFYAYKGTPLLNGIFDTMNSLKASARANEPLLDTPLLLPLEFVLETLSSTLESQQIAADVSGNITVGRFGSLRGISFGLIVMLGMNLNDFPRTVTNNSLDLRAVGLPRRGDRVSEDDDNGTFLEALLQARDACYIFYSGQSADGTLETLPASPVTELVQFIKNAHCQDTKGNALTPEAIEGYLVTRHQALPFWADRFGAYTLLAPLWQNVACNIGQETAIAKPVVLPTQEEIDKLVQALTEKSPALPKPLPATLDIARLSFALKNPARTYLTGKKSPTPSLETVSDEPLVLDNLQQYKLISELHEQTSEEVLRYGGYLPAGVAGAQTLQELQRQHTKWYKHGLQSLQNMDIIKQESDATSVHLLPFRLGEMSVTLQVMLPKDNPDIWFNAMVGKAHVSDYKLVTAFLQHLCWQITRTDATKESNAGKSFWYYNAKDNADTTGFLCYFKPLSSDDAQAILARFIVVYSHLQVMPIALSSSMALMLLTDKDLVAVADSDLQTKQAGIKKALKSSWFGAGSRYTGYVSSDSQHHPDWQYILGKEDDGELIAPLLPLVGTLYQALYDHLEIVTDGTESGVAQ